MDRRIPDGDRSPAMGRPAQCPCAWRLAQQASSQRAILAAGHDRVLGHGAGPGGRTSAAPPDALAAPAGPVLTSLLPASGWSCRSANWNGKLTRRKPQAGKAWTLARSTPQARTRRPAMSPGSSPTCAASTPTCRPENGAFTRPTGGYSLRSMPSGPAKMPSRPPIPRRKKQPRPYPRRQAVTSWPKTTQPGKVQNRGKEGSGLSVTDRRQPQFSARSGTTVARCERCMIRPVETTGLVSRQLSAVALHLAPQDLVTLADVRVNESSIDSAVVSANHCRPADKSRPPASEFRRHMASR